MHLPSVLRPIFAGLPRRVDIDAATVGEAIAELDRRFPGLQDRLCHPGPELRMHIHVYVDGDRSDLATPLQTRSRLDVIAAISGG